MNSVHLFLAALLLAASAHGTGTAASTVQSLDSDGWRIAADPKNEGRDAKWFVAPREEAKPTKVPWIIQDPFPGYHGVAWYWREFDAPKNPHADGRYLLRFWAVDYLAEVWLNGKSVGAHEGGETPFVLDVTEAVRPGARNLLVIRVLNPANEPIDGIVLNETPHRNKVIPYRAGGSYNHGGIVDSVELLVVPAVRIEDVFSRPDTATGKVRVRAQVRNAARSERAVQLEFAVAPAPSGETLQRIVLDRKLSPGDMLIETELHVIAPRRWEPSEPNLYRVTARVQEKDRPSWDERSVRCGFRDFTFENGCFRLNGRRLFLRCSHTGNHCPVGLQLPPDPDMLRRDLLNVKVMGFNAIRFIAGVATRYQLDLCDEIGLMVYEEPYAAWALRDSPKMAERFDESLTGMIRRDRNHPSVVIWGLLNETYDGPVFRHATAALPKLRELDDTRMVMLNSGRWDLKKTGGAEPPGARPTLGSLSNPGTREWQDVLDDQHPYQRVPHTASVIHKLRTFKGNKNPMFISEYGVGSAVDLWRVTRHYERLDKTHAEDAQFYRDKLDCFLADWERWKMAECFATPQDLFAQSIRQMAAERLCGMNALRANPGLVAYSLTGTVDQGMSGEGLFTTFRELKPGTTDAMFEALAPLRLCLFAEPGHVYRGGRVRCEAVLANEDALAPGDYPVRLLAVGPQNQRVFEKTVNVAIAKNAPFAVPIFAEDVVVNGPAGRYRFLASFERGGAATGGEAGFFVADRAEMPAVKVEVVLAGDDAGLATWLTDHGIRSRKLFDGEPTQRDVILVSTKPPAFEEVWRRVEQGTTAVFLAPEVLKKGNEPLGWLPLKNKGSLARLRGWLYHKDEWAKAHPAFDGLPAGGLMDYAFYREIIPDLVFAGQDPPAQAIAGTNDTSFDYSSGLTLAEYRLGAGRFILNTLLIRENLGAHPVAERLLRNLLNHAASQSR